MDVLMMTRLARWKLYTLTENCPEYMDISSQPYLDLVNGFLIFFLPGFEEGLGIFNHLLQTVFWLLEWKGTQVQARMPLARGIGHSHVHSTQNDRQAAPSMVIPLFCWRVLCQKQRREADRDNVWQLQPWASGHSLSASALASRHLSPRERAGPGQRC